jgi:hypothetical protein
MKCYTIVTMDNSTSKNIILGYMVYFWFLQQVISCKYPHEMNLFAWNEMKSMWEYVILFLHASSMF